MVWAKDIAAGVSEIVPTFSDEDSLSQVNVGNLAGMGKSTEHNMEQATESLGVRACRGSKSITVSHYFQRRQGCIVLELVREELLYKRLSYGSIKCGIRESVMPIFLEAKIPPKVQFFLWKLEHKVLPTKVFLAGRLHSLNLLPVCNWCMLKEETIPHLFLECELAQWCWTEVCNSWSIYRGNSSFRHNSGARGKRGLANGGIDCIMDYMVVQKFSHL